MAKRTLPETADSDVEDSDHESSASTNASARLQYLDGREITHSYHRDQSDLSSNAKDTSGFSQMNHSQQTQL
jgi:hypothetical protein